jgi:hypothetical protein
MKAIQEQLDELDYHLNEFRNSKSLSIGKCWDLLMNTVSGLKSIKKNKQIHSQKCSEIANEIINHIDNEDYGHLVQEISIRRNDKSINQNSRFQLRKIQPDEIHEQIILELWCLKLMKPKEINHLDKPKDCIDIFFELINQSDKKGYDYDIVWGLSFLDPRNIYDLINSSNSLIYKPEFNLDKTTEEKYYKTLKKLNDNELSFWSKNNPCCCDSCLCFLNDYRKNDSSCFIATMVYESPEHKQVKYLRHFRDNYLSKSKVGRFFIKYYYEFSPKVVAKLQDNRLINNLIKDALDIVISILKFITK